MPVNGVFYDPLVSPCSSRPRKGSDCAQATPPTTPCFGAPLTPDAEGDPREDVAVVHVPPLEQRVCATVLESGACERLGSKIRMEDVVCIASWSVEEDEKEEFRGTVNLFMVFDGHHGRSVSAFSGLEFGRICKEVMLASQPGSTHRQVLIEAFFACHEEVRAHDLRGGSAALVMLHQGEQSNYPCGAFDPPFD